MKKGSTGRPTTGTMKSSQAGPKAVFARRRKDLTPADVAPGKPMKSIAP